MAIEPHHSNKALQELIDKLSEQSGSSNHESLQGLLGGNSFGHYHLTVDLLNKLINLPIGGGGNNIDIINNLNSNRTDAALSANMGRELNDKIKNYYSESWTFTLDDNSTVTKKVVLTS